MDTRSKEMHSKTEISITESYSSRFRLPLPYSFSVISSKSLKKNSNSSGSIRGAGLDTISRQILPESRKILQFVQPFDKMVLHFFRESDANMFLMRFYDLLCNEIDRIRCNKWKLKSLVLKT